MSSSRTTTKSSNSAKKGATTPDSATPNSSNKATTPTSLNSLAKTLSNNSKEEDPALEIANQMMDPGLAVVLDRPTGVFHNGSIPGEGGDAKRSVTRATFVVMNTSANESPLSTT